MILLSFARYFVYNISQSEGNTLPYKQFR